jgi:polysaccharide export outer membrane protein
METFFKILKGFFVIGTGIYLILAMAGCQTTKPVADSQLTVAPAADLEPRPEPVPLLNLGPGDVLDFKFFNTPELNDSQTVRPDGKIMLQLIGEVTAQGKTPEELRAELIKRYTPELRNPEVAVIVRSLSDRRVYVGGEVNKPGIIPMPGRLTALEAIIEAGDFKMETAKLKSVVVIRQREGKFRGSVIDLSGTPNGEAGPPFSLQPRDIIYVPEAAIVKVDRWVDQYIYKIFPVRNIGFGITWIP